MRRLAAIMTLRKKASGIAVLKLKLENEGRDLNELSHA